MHSCLYEGRVRHHRFGPIRHQFSYRLSMMYLDLAELPTLFARRWLWGYERRTAVAFHREDYLGDAGVPLAESIRALVRQQTGRTPTGPIRLLTQLRHFGYCFNPLSVYFCFDSTGQAVETIVAEVTNIPWGERHAYVLDMAGAPAGGERFAKQMHVSPFLPMELQYAWRMHGPARGLAIRLAALDNDAPRLEATLSLVRREITAASLASAICRYPLMTAKITAAIHWQALRLWWKKCRLYSHPGQTLASR